MEEVLWRQGVGKEKGACRLLASPQLECEWVLDVHHVIVLFCLILEVFLVDLKHLLYCPGLGLQIR